MQKLAGVLLVDDDPATNHLNERLLRGLDFTDHYLHATDGAEALQRLAEFDAEGRPPGPVLVLLDLNMPGMGGMDFAAALQRLPPDRQQAVVVVLHTATMSSADLGRLNGLPIAGLVSKPLTREKLDTVLQLHFQRQLPPP